MKNRNWKRELGDELENIKNYIRICSPHPPRSEDDEWRAPGEPDKYIIKILLEWSLQLESRIEKIENTLADR